MQYNSKPIKELDDSVIVNSTATGKVIFLFLKLRQDQVGGVMKLLHQINILTASFNR